MIRLLKKVKEMFLLFVDGSSLGSIYSLSSFYRQIHYIHYCFILGYDDRQITTSESCLKTYSEIGFNFN